MSFWDAVTAYDAAKRDFERRVAPLIRDADKAEAKYRAFKKAAARWPS
jgi:hypothetical protein